MFDLLCRCLWYLCASCCRTHRRDTRPVPILGVHFTHLALPTVLDTSSSPDTVNSAINTTRAILCWANILSRQSKAACQLTSIQPVTAFSAGVTTSQHLTDQRIRSCAAAHTASICKLNLFNCNAPCLSTCTQGEPIAKARDGQDVALVGHAGMCPCMSPPSC